MTQTRSKPERVAAMLDVLKAHGTKAEDLTAIQSNIDLLIDDEIHVHIETDDVHIHIDWPEVFT